MNRWTLIPLLIPAVACDLTQSLQGPASDSGTPGEILGDAAPPTGQDGGVLPGADSSPSGGDSGGGGIDANGGDAPQPSLSACPPAAQSGTAKVLVDGSQPYMLWVDEVFFGKGSVFAFAPPWSVAAVPLAGGAVQAYAFSASLPSYIAGAVGPVGSFVAGSLTNQNVEAHDLSGNQGVFFGLKGAAAGMIGARHGDIVVDGTDSFFWTKSPAQLVQASLSGGLERVLAQYADATQETVTAMTLTPTLVYFTTVVGDSTSLSNITLHSAPRSGGSVSDVLSFPTAGAEPPDGILLDGSTAYVTQRDTTLGTSNGFLWVVDLTNATSTLQMFPQGSGSEQYKQRTTSVAFDGTQFYWGQANGMSCGGSLLRADKTSISTLAPAETLLEGLDTPLAVEVSSGNAYVGTEGDQINTPGTPGQLLVWNP